VASQIENIKDYTKFDNDCSLNGLAPNFFSIDIKEPSDWILAGMRASLAFVYDDQDMEFLMNTCTWDKGKYFSVLKLSRKKEEIFSRLNKIIEDPINLLSKNKIDSIDRFINDNLDLMQKCYRKVEISTVLIYMYEIIKTSIRVMKYLFKKYPKTLYIKKKSNNNINETNNNLKEKKVVHRLGSNQLELPLINITSSDKKQGTKAFKKLSSYEVNKSMMEALNSLTPDISTRASFESLSELDKKKGTECIFNSQCRTDSLFSMDFNRKIKLPKMSSIEDFCQDENAYDNLKNEFQNKSTRSQTRRGSNISTTSNIKLNAINLKYNIKVQNECTIEDNLDGRRISRVGSNTSISPTKSFKIKRSTRISLSPVVKSSTNL